MKSVVTYALTMRQVFAVILLTCFVLEVVSAKSIKGTPQQSHHNDGAHLEPESDRTSSGKEFNSKIHIASEFDRSNEPHSINTQTLAIISDNTNECNTTEEEDDTELVSKSNSSDSVEIKSQNESHSLEVVSEKSENKEHEFFSGTSETEYNTETESSTDTKIDSTATYGVDCDENVNSEEDERSGTAEINHNNWLERHIEAILNLSESRKTFVAHSFEKIESNFEEQLLEIINQHALEDWLKQHSETISDGQSERNDGAHFGNKLLHTGKLSSISCKDGWKDLLREIKHPSEVTSYCQSREKLEGELSSNVISYEWKDLLEHHIEGKGKLFHRISLLHKLINKQIAEERKFPREIVDYIQSLKEEFNKIIKIEANQNIKTYDVESFSTILNPIEFAPYVDPGLSEVAVEFLELQQKILIESKQILSKELDCCKSEVGVNKTNCERKIILITKVKVLQIEEALKNCLKIDRVKRFERFISAVDEFEREVDKVAEEVHNALEKRKSFRRKNFI